MVKVLVINEAYVAPPPFEEVTKLFSSRTGKYFLRLNLGLWLVIDSEGNVLDTSVAVAVRQLYENENLDVTTKDFEVQW